jgi:CRISPR-associated endonuclease/helicase Cas3
MSKKVMIDNKIDLSSCWAKLNDDGTHRQNIVTHCVLVGHIARIIIEELVNPFLPKDIKIDVSIVPVIAGHDYGKIHVLFLIKGKEWQEKVGSIYLNINEINNIKSSLYLNDQSRPEFHHSVVGARLFQTEVLGEIITNSMGDIKVCTDVLLKHHGYIKSNPRPHYEDYIDLYPLRKKFIDDIESRFGKISDIDRDSPIFDITNKCIHNNLNKLLNGITIYSDWLASDLDWIKDGTSDQEMIEKIRASLSQKGIVQIYNSLKKPQLAFDEIFPFKMNELQQCVNDIKISTSRDRGSLWVIEDQTGRGKTEAALFLIYKFLMLNMVNGFYFGLTSQATSNNVYKRINEFANKIRDTHGNNVKLVHAHSFLTEETQMFLRNSTHRFYDTNKKGILYPFAVGTVDQILLSVLNAKHADLRFFALHNKVVVYDEIHSYGIYTSVLIKESIKKLISVGCIVMLLSATLTKGAKKYLLDMDVTKDLYPMITRIRQ